MANYGTILVVDDNPAILTAVKICLAGEFDRVLTLASPDTLLVDRPKPKQAVLSGVSPLREVHVEQNHIHLLLCQYRKKRVGRNKRQYFIKLTGQTDPDCRKNRRIIIHHQYRPVIRHIRFV